MELFEVELEYKNWQTWKDWEEECRSHVATVPVPKSLKTKVAVSPSYGDEMIARASGIAIEGIIGKPEVGESRQSFLDKWQVMILRITHLGSIVVEA